MRTFFKEQESFNRSTPLQIMSAEGLDRRAEAFLRLM